MFQNAIKFLKILVILTILTPLSADPNSPAKLVGFRLVNFDNYVKVSFELSRMVRGKLKTTLAEVPGLFASATVVVCFGGRDQQISIAKCAAANGASGSADDAAPRRKARDIFNDALSGERVAPVPFTAPAKVNSYAEQIRDIAATMESSM